MKTFSNASPRDPQQAVKLAQDAHKGGKAVSFSSGGSDLLALVKERIVKPDVIVNLRGLSNANQIAAAAAQSAGVRRDWVLWSALAALLLLLVAAAAMGWWRTPSPRPVLRATLLPPTGTQFALLNRNGKQVRLTDEGERLLSYARRILALAEEAHHVVARPADEGIVRVGLPEDFAANRLAQVLARFARSHPRMRLDVRCDLGVCGIRRKADRDSDGRRTAIR